MKPTLPLLALSLAANAALLAFVLLRSAPAPAPVTSAPTPAITSPSVPGTGALATGDAAALARAREVLATGDLPTLVGRLRAAGFSASDIRAIVGARLSQAYGAERAAAVAQQEIVPYWRSSQSFPEDPKAGGTITALFREQAAQLKQLLGPDADPDDAWSKLIHDRQYGYLPAEKTERLQTLLADYTEMRTALQREARPMWLPEDRERIALLDKEQQADLAKLFTSEELEAYQLHSSQTAYMMRYQLSAFAPTEDEFRALYRLNNDTNLLSHRPLTPAESQQVEAALGPARMTEFLQTTDQQYMQTNNLATRLDLPATVVPQILSLQRDLSQRFDKIQNDSSLTPPMKQEAIAALASEADAKFPTLLGGDSGYQAYRATAGGWLGNLKNPPPLIVTGGYPGGTIISTKPQPVFQRSGGNGK